MSTVKPSATTRSAAMHTRSSHVQTARLVLGGSIAASIGIALATGFLSPIPAGLSEPEGQFRGGIVSTSLFALFYIGAALLFMLSLKDFKPRLRRAYAVICCGLILLSLNFLQFPIFSILALWDRAWFAQGGANIPYIIALVLSYAGIRKFAKILEVTSAWNSISFVSMLAMGAGVVGYGLTQGILPYDTTPLNITLGSEFALAALGLASFCLILRIKQNIGPAYTTALTWFSWALLAQIIAVLVPALYDITGTEKDALLGISALITASLYLRAGYVFNKINSYERSTPKDSKGESPVDVIVYTASLASNPKAIDSILDGLREVTARLDPAKPLAKTDQAVLAGVYVNLEAYLVSKEPLRVFTKPQLRQKIQDKFEPSTTAYATFWTQSGLSG